ncbi:hypothetical protein ACJA28_03415 [Mesomycoplasma moatsii]|uniref:hypothetical protein n=1 Tax=Mesomycoplasma moatsii TaxID=171287 RepID=UPI003872CE43
MKKSTKKLLGLGTSLLIGSAGVIAGIGALKLDQSGSSINQNNASRAVQNDGFGLTSHDSFIIGKNLNQTEIYNSTPNVTKPVPNGYVTINKNNQLICIDKNDPNKVLWYSNYGSGYNVLATEYTPYEDTLVVLYTDEKRNAGDSVRIKVCKYPNISSKTDGGEFTTWEDKVVNTYTYDGNTFRNDTWGLSPIYKTSTSDGDNAQVTSYLIYPKLHTDNNNLGSWGSDKIFEYSVKDKSVQNRKFKYHYTDRYQAIMGMGSWIYGDKIHAVLLMLRKGSTGSWIEVEYLVQEDNKEYFASKGIKNPGSSADGNFWSGSSWAIISEAVRSNISGAAFSYNYDTSDMKVTFALNAFGGYDAFGNSNNFHKNGQLITTSVWCGGQQFSGTSGPWRNNLWTETWGGYFDNSVIAAKGIKNTTASPLLLEGYDQRIQDSSKGYDGRFTAVINNPTSWGNDTFNPTKTLNNSRWRIYMQTDDEAVNASNSTYYSNFSTSVDISQNYRLGLNQGAFGIPVLEYHNDNNNDSTIFNLNVMFMKNGSNNGIIINQKDRGSNTQNKSTYGYYTHASATSNTISGYGDSSYAVSLVDKAYLYDKLKLGGNISYWYSSSFMNALSMKNVRDDAKFLIKEDTITHNYNAGSVSFDLYSTIVYTNTGLLNYSDVNSMEGQGNWWTNHKIGTFTLTGFKTVKVTEIKNFKIDSSLTFGGKIIAPYLVPSEIVTNQYGSNTKVDFKNLVWQSICRGDVFTNLVSTPTYNESSWEQDFNAFFPRFDIESDSATKGQFNNAEGSVTLSVKVSKRWAVPAPNSNEDLVSFNNWTISGLRKVGATQFVNNTEATAFINPNWSNKNIPYADGSTYNKEIQWPDYVAPNVEKITVDEIKEFLFENYIKPAYDAATKENQYETSTQWVKNVAYKTNYGLQSDGAFNNNELTKDNIVIMNYKYFPATGKMRLDIRLNVWNENDQMLHWAQGVEVNGIQGTQKETDAPFGTWWIGGFRTDNVTTSFDEENVYDLAGVTWNNYQISSTIASQSLVDSSYRTLVRKAIIEKSIEYGYLKLPYWVDPSSIPTLEGGYGELSLVQLVESDNGKGTASFKIYLKRTNYQAQSDGKVANVGENKTWTIKTYRI